MIIAVNTRILSGDAAAGKLLFDIVAVIVQNNPSQQFIFISDKEGVAIPSFSNATAIAIKQQSNNPLLWKLWYNYKLPALLRKIKADLLLSADGICSLRTRVPQCMIVNELEFLHHPEWSDKNHAKFIRTVTPACLQKANAVITYAGHVKNELSSKYKTEENKIEVICPAANRDHQPIHWQQREIIKEKYTAGKEYFLFKGLINERSHLINLLKAFSLFKKRQKSNMQLVIAADVIPGKDSFIESLRLYKYRDEIKVLIGLPEAELQLMTAAAYSAISLSPFMSDIHFLLNAIQCEVPVITANNGRAKELLAAAALYADPSSFEHIAEQLMLLYKDEKKRNDLIAKGREQSVACSLEKTAQQLWQNILAAAGQ